MTILWMPIESMSRVGSLELSARAGVGELSLEHAFDVEPGIWAAYLSTEDQLDDLVDELVDRKGRELDDDEYPWMQLLLVHETARLPEELADLATLHELSMEAARFALLDEPAWACVEGDDGFSEHLDGVEGLVLGGRGVQVLTGGDGRAVIHGSARRRVLLVDLR